MYNETVKEMSEDIHETLELKKSKKIKEKIIL